MAAKSVIYKEMLNKTRNVIDIVYINNNIVIRTWMLRITEGHYIEDAKKGGLLCGGKINRNILTSIAKYRLKQYYLVKN